jgi:hypothetical protein
VCVALEWVFGVQRAAVAGVLYTPQDGMQEKMELERTSPGDRSIDRWNTGMQLCEADLRVPMGEQACHVCLPPSAKQRQPTCK